MGDGLKRAIDAARATRGLGPKYGKPMGPREAIALLTKPKSRKRPEQTLHLQVADYLRVALRPPTFWTAIDHASGVANGRLAGALRKARGVKAGLPDILIIQPAGHAPHYPEVYGIELKASKGRMSDAQISVQASFRNAGCEYEDCKSVGELESLLKRWGIPLHAKL